MHESSTQARCQVGVLREREFASARQQCPADLILAAFRHIELHGRVAGGESLL